jgi:hypothetical protein
MTLIRRKRSGHLDIRESGKQENLPRMIAGQENAKIGTAEDTEEHGGNQKLTTDKHG